METNSRDQNMKVHVGEKRKNEENLESEKRRKIEPQIVKKKFLKEKLTCFVQKNTRRKLKYLLRGGEDLMTGLVVKEFKHILDENGWTEKTQQFGDVDLAWGVVIVKQLSNEHFTAAYSPEFTKQKAKLKSYLDDEKQVITSRLSLFKELIKIPGGAQFIPPTYFLSEVNSINPGEVLIIKREGSFHRNGVFIVDNQDDFSECKKKIISEKKTSEAGVVSKYLSDPLLCKGKKFHLRIYMMIYVSDGTASAHVLDIYRVCTASEPYQKKDWKNKKIHLTGSEFTQELIMEALKCIALTIIPKAGYFTEEAKAAFEVFRIDILLDNNGHPWILEANDKVSYGLFGSKEDWVEYNTQFSKTYFEWLTSSVIFPHFGIPTSRFYAPLCSGPSRKLYNSNK